LVQIAVVEGLLEHRGEVLMRRRNSGNSHELSCCGAPAVDDENAFRTDGAGGPAGPPTTAKRVGRPAPWARPSERLFDLRLTVFAVARDKTRAGSRTGRADPPRR